ncbi:MAG: hypothetical protein ACREX3_05580 [Gammaproteobacteria bacterium]
MTWLPACPDFASVTAAGTAPQVTPPTPLHAKLNVFDAEPVFVTVNDSL